MSKIWVVWNPKLFDGKPLHISEQAITYKLKLISSKDIMKGVVEGSVERRLDISTNYIEINYGLSWWVIST